VVLAIVLGQTVVLIAEAAMVRAAGHAAVLVIPPHLPTLLLSTAHPHTFLLTRLLLLLLLRVARVVLAIVLGLTVVLTAEPMMVRTAGDAAVVAMLPPPHLPTLLLLFLLSLLEPPIWLLPPISTEDKEVVLDAA